MIDDNARVWAFHTHLDAVDRRFTCRSEAIAAQTSLGISTAIGRYGAAGAAHAVSLRAYFAARGPRIRDRFRARILDRTPKTAEQT